MHVFVAFDTPDGGSQLVSENTDDPAAYLLGFLDFADTHPVQRVAIGGTVLSDIPEALDYLDRVA